MGKIKNLGFQIYSALNEINLQDADKRTALFNNINHTDLNYVGKREFKKLGQTKEYIFSKRTAENTVEKSKCFTKFLKENYGIKLVKQITPDMAIAYRTPHNDLPTLLQSLIEAPVSIPAVLHS